MNQTVVLATPNILAIALNWICFVIFEANLLESMMWVYNNSVQMQTRCLESASDSLIFLTEGARLKECTNMKNSTKC